MELSIFLVLMTLGCIYLLFNGDNIGCMYDILVVIFFFPIISCFIFVVFFIILLFNIDDFFFDLIITICSWSLFVVYCLSTVCSFVYNRLPLNCLET